MAQPPAGNTSAGKPRFFQLLPHPECGVRHVKVCDTQVRKGIHHGAGEGRDTADVRRLGYTLGTQRMVR
jgi:hypothetical protein